MLLRVDNINFHLFFAVPLRKVYWTLLVNLVQGSEVSRLLQENFLIVIESINYRRNEMVVFA